MIELLLHFHVFVSGASDAPSPKARLYFFDSNPNSIHRQMFEPAILFQLTSNGFPVESESIAATPVQQNDSKTCGFHVLLNAKLVLFSRKKDNVFWRATNIDLARLHCRNWYKPGAVSGCKRKLRVLCANWTAADMPVLTEDELAEMSIQTSSSSSSSSSPSSSPSSSSPSSSSSSSSCPLPPTPPPSTSSLYSSSFTSSSSCPPPPTPPPSTSSSCSSSFTSSSSPGKPEHEPYMPKCMNSFIWASLFFI